MGAVAQRSFAGGEIAPALYARTDIAKYATGLRKCRNMIIQRHGGAANRPGTVFIAGAKDSAVACRLASFVFDATDIADTYLLELGNGYIRFYQDAGRVEVSSVTAWANATAYVVGDLRSYLGVNYYCRAAHTSATATDRPSTGSAWQTAWYALEDAIFEIPAPYTTADLAGLRFSQSGDVIVITHEDYATRELSRLGHTDWTLTEKEFGPSIDAPQNVTASSAGAAGTTYYGVTAIKEGTLEESLAGLYTFAKVPTSINPASVSWSQVAGAISYNVYRSEDGLTYGLINSAGGLPLAKSDNTWADSTETANASALSTWAASVGQLRNACVAAIANKAYDGNYTVWLRWTLTGIDVDDFEGRFRVYYSRDGEARIEAAFFPVARLFAAGVSGPNAMQVTINVPDNGYTTLTIDVVPEAMFSSVTGGAPSAALNVNTATAPDDKITWTAGASGFTDDGDAPDYSIAPPANPTVFDAAGRYPAASTYFQQRLLLGGSDDEPETVRGSRIGSFNNFAQSTPLAADDPVTFSLAGKRVNRVKHLLELVGKAVIFGSNFVQIVDGDDAGILRADAINVKKLSANGCGTVAPVEVDDSAIYVHRTGRKLLDLKSIGMDGYQGNDLTIMAAHLLERYAIVDLAYQEVPNSVLWAVRADGVLLGLTYIRDQAVWGWHRHDTDGTIENVCVVPEDDEEAVYLVVAREIDGETVRYIERMADRYFTDIEDAVFMDAALTYDGWTVVGTRTVTASGGSSWTSTEQVTLTASSAIFASTNVGDAVHMLDDDGNLVRFTIEAFTSTTVVTARADRDVPASMQSVAIGNGSGEWALAVDAVSGLEHLEGCAVSVLGDGVVVASPNNSAYPECTVAAAVVTLDRPYAKIQVGLPYMPELETLDLDGPGLTTTRNKKMLVNKVGLLVERSRGIWVGRPDQVDGDDDLTGLYKLKQRETEDYDDPTDLLTDYVEVSIDQNWNNNGRVLVRQPDPLPLTVLAAIPILQG